MRPLSRSPPRRAVLSLFLSARSRFFLLTWLLSRTCALRCAAQYFETETRALFREKIQQASTRRAARVAERLEPGIPQSGWSLDPRARVSALERDVAQRNTATNGKIVPDGTNERPENDDDDDDDNDDDDNDDNRDHAEQNEYIRDAGARNGNLITFYCCKADLSAIFSSHFFSVTIGYDHVATFNINISPLISPLFTRVTIYIYFNEQ